MKVTRRDFNKAGIGALSLAALGGGNALAAPDPLIRKAIPSSGELVPVIGLGTNRYGVGDDAGKRALLRAALMRFRELGGTVIDTAPMYRSSEAVLGDLIADLAIRDDLFIATKADEEPGGDATDAQMRESQRRLKTDSFDLMQVHNLVSWQEHLETLYEMKAAGDLRYIGITTSHGRRHKEFEAVMKTRELDFVQFSYNLIDREAEILDRALEHAAPGRGGGAVHEQQRSSPATSSSRWNGRRTCCASTPRKPAA